MAATRDTGSQSGELVGTSPKLSIEKRISRVHFRDAPATPEIVAYVGSAHQETLIEQTVKNVLEKLRPVYEIVSHIEIYFLKDYEEAEELFLCVDIVLVDPFFGKSSEPVTVMQGMRIPEADSYLNEDDWSLIDELVGQISRGVRRQIDVFRDHANKADQLLQRLVKTFP